MKGSHSFGFTLIETLLSLALTALVVGILMLTTKQFLITWQTGLGRLDDVETLALAEIAIRRDINSLLLFSPDRDRPVYSFEGRSDSLRIFSEAPQREVGYSFVAIDFHTFDGKGLMRSTSSYDGSIPIDQIIFSKGEILIPRHYGVRFSYVDERGAKLTDWRSTDLPRMITIEILGLDEKSVAIWPIDIKQRVPAVCVRAENLKACRELLQVGHQGIIQ